MTSGRAREIFAKYSNAVAYVEVEDEFGDRSIGSAFHIGGGVFVTARHVVENKILDVRITEPMPVRAAEFYREFGVSEENIQRNDESLKEMLGHYPLYKHWDDSLEIVSGPFFDNNENVDLAVFKVKSIHNSAGVVLLGNHWDDWIYRGVWHLADSVVLGYPPIPMSCEPLLIASKAQIHTYFVPRHSSGVHFILSGIPRGGFSGGPAFTEDGFALGVVTSSFVNSGHPVELGFFAVVSVETIVKCLEAHGLFPDVQRNHLYNFDRCPLGVDKKG